MGARALDPLRLVLSLGLIAVFAIVLQLAHVPLHPAQQLTALVVILFFLVAVLLSPTNGLVLLFLLPPVFNGEDGRPYFYLLEVLVYLTLLVGFAAHLWRRRPLGFPYAPFFLLFLVSTVISLPLNLKETWVELEVSSWREILEGVRRSDLSANLFYVRTVLNVLSGIGLYVLVVNQRWTRDAVLRLALAATVLYAGVSLIGLWLYWFADAPGRTFLTLWLGGSLNDGFTGLGFNVSYFAQYALAYLPLAALVAAEGVSRWAKGLAFVALVLSAYTIVVTYQRGAYLVLLVELGLLLLVGLSGGFRVGVTVLAAVGSVLLTLTGLLFSTALGSRVFQLVLALWQQGDPYRRNAFRAAWQMFRDQPLLGIGSGRFARVFSSYHPDPWMQWGSLSAHNLYAQFLAEQGAVGLLSFLMLLAVTLGGVIRRLRQLQEARTVALFLLVSLVSWLTYGWLQYTFLMRSMQIYFWIALGLLVALASPVLPRLRLSRRVVAAAVAVMVVAVGFRAQAALSRPIPRGYAWGLHDWHGAGGVVWTRGGAVLNLPVEGRVLRLAFAFPVIKAAGRPQTVSILLDGSLVRRIPLDTPGWAVVEIPVEKPLGSTVLLQMRVGYTFTPAALGLAADERRFGVLMRPITWAQP